MRNTLLAITLCTVSFGLFAKPSINDMQGCQALIDFVEAKLDPKPDQYNSEEVSTVLKGLTAYDQYIQSEIVSPGLLQFNGNDKEKADAMQKQVDTYKASVTKAYNAKYPQPKLFMDHAVAINECAKKAVPTGADLEALKSALQTMVVMVKK